MISTLKTARVEPSRVRSVALVGMDGSGKSTQARMLCETLRGQGKAVLLIHPFGHKLLAFLPERLTAHVGGGTGVDQAGSRSGGARTAGRGRQLAALVELLDVGVYLWLSYARSVLLARTGKREVWLVSDRSFDDLLIKHRRRGSLPARTLDLARRLVPHPVLTIWLETRPEVAMARDREFKPSYYEELYAAYERAAQKYGWDTVSTANRSPSEVLAEIRRAGGLRSEPEVARGAGVRAMQPSEMGQP